MQLNSSPNPLEQQKKDAVIVLVQSGKPLIPTKKSSFKKQITDLIAQTGFKGANGETTLLPGEGNLSAKCIILAGLGEASTFHNGTLEQAVAAAVKTGIRSKLKTFSIANTQPASITESAFQLICGRGACWGSYSFSALKSNTSNLAKTSFTFSDAKKSTVIKQAELQGDALLQTADLANLPGNLASPEHIAAWAKKMADNTGLSCEIKGPKSLKKLGCGAFLSVAQGSAQEPRMITLKYAGTVPNAKPIILVGKTVTFDSGGISLKPGKGMGWMRYDKCGGMAVLTAMQMIARTQPATPVIGILGAAENMPGASATRPGDIITTHSGKTVEILNTDAEGRLILADVLSIAAKMKPRAIVDVATLTGACIMALGNVASAVLGNDDRLIQELLHAGETAGERLWQLPLYPEYTDAMQSDFADLSNLSKAAGAGTATAAAFLKEFIPDNIPWAHLDIAGTAWLESSKPHQAAGATLFGARLLTDWICAQA